MLCLLSFIFTLLISTQTITKLENNNLELLQIFYNIYGFIMFYQTSKPFWSERGEKNNE